MIATMARIFSNTAAFERAPRMLSYSTASSHSRSRRSAL